MGAAVMAAVGAAAVEAATAEPEAGGRKAEAIRVVLWSRAICSSVGLAGGGGSAGIRMRLRAIGGSRHRASAAHNPAIGENVTMPLPQTKASFSIRPRGNEAMLLRLGSRTPPITWAVLAPRRR